MSRNLPEGWVWTTIGEVADLVRGVSFRKADAKSEAAPGLVPIARAGNVEPGRARLENDLVFVPVERVSEKQYLRSGDVLITTSSGSASVVGKSAVITDDWHGAHGAFMGVLRAGSRVVPRFLGYYVQSHAVRERWRAASVGTNINNLKKADILETSIPLPPRNEQDRIVEALEESLARLRVAKAEIEASLARLAGLPALVLSRALSDGAGWATYQMSDIAELSLGKMLDKKRQTGEHSTQYLRNINVRWGRFDLTDLAVMDIAPTELTRVQVRAGDLVMCEGGEPGRCAVWRGDQPIAIQKALHRVRLAPHIWPEFVSLVFRQKAASQELDRYFTGSTIKHLPKQQLARIEIAVPAIESQRAIVREVEELESEVLRVSHSVEVALRRSSDLRRSVLETAFSGGLALQDSSDESASQLLEKIAADQKTAGVAPEKKAAS